MEELKIPHVGKCFSSRKYFTMENLNIHKSRENSIMSHCAPISQLQQFATHGQFCFSYIHHFQSPPCPLPHTEEIILKQI